MEEIITEDLKLYWFNKQFFNIKTAGMSSTMWTLENIPNHCSFGDYLFNRVFDGEKTTINFYKKIASKEI